ncbi:MAG TPA: ABC transporter permease [Acidobacteriaceae bacterium]|nr:ABC transporter permease [Acidobacteriaceae bacterium]
MLNLRQASMRNVWIIAHREYMERIRTRGFLITTVMIPLIIGGFAFGSTFLAAKANTDLRIAVVSHDQRFTKDLNDELQREATAKQNDTSTAGNPGTGRAAKPLKITVVAIDPTPGATKQLDEGLDSGALDGYLLLTQTAEPGARPVFSFTPRTSGMAYVNGALAAALDKVLLREQLEHRGFAAQDTNALLQPVTVTEVKRINRENTASAEVCVSVLFFVMYLVIMLYGMNVARSIIEEKTSRIFEVMMATIRPEALMAGKIIGVGSVGLTQVGIWLGMLLILAASSVAIHLGGDTLHIALTGPQVIFFFVYFILGYLLYSSIAAALGAITNSEQELQQMNMFLVLPLLSCFVLLGTLVSTPDNTLARVLALVPLFTPLLMYFRVSVGHPALWEIVLSLVLTSATICGIILVTSRIYRIGVLMYGKRPNMAEIRRWISYS